MCPYLTYQASEFVVRSIPSAMPCYTKREGSWHRETMVFATYIPVADPDLQIRGGRSSRPGDKGGGEGGLKKNVFGPPGLIFV